MDARHGARMQRLGPELSLVRRQTVGLQLRRPPGGVVAHQHEVPVVGHQHPAIALEVAQHLVARRHRGDLLPRGLHFDHASRRHLIRLGLSHRPAAHRPAGFRPLAFELIEGVETAIRDARPLFMGVKNAACFGLEPAADLIQQVGQGGIAGGLGHATAQAGVVEGAEVGLERVHRASTIADTARSTKRMGLRAQTAADGLSSTLAEA